MHFKSNPETKQIPIYAVWYSGKFTDRQMTAHSQFETNQGLIKNGWVRGGRILIPTGVLMKYVEDSRKPDNKEDGRFSSICKKDLESAVRGDNRILRSIPRFFSISLSTFIQSTPQCLLTRSIEGRFVDVIAVHIL